MNRRQTVIPALLCATLACVASASDWPQWRGPQRDGRAAADNLPAEWPEELSQSWQIAVGEGHAAPVVVDRRVYQFARQDEREIVRAIGLANGDVLWQDDYDAPYEMHNAARNHGKGPKSTPAIAGGRLATFGISGILSCYDGGTGDLRWRKDFAGEFEKTSPLYGAAASPIVFRDDVIVHVGGHDRGALRSFDLATGEVNWSWDGDGPGYASPLIATIDGSQQLITQTQSAVIGVDPTDGTLLWQIPFKTPYDQNSITPIVEDGILIYGGVQQPTTAVRVARTGDGWSTSEVWSNKDTAVYMSTPVLVGKKLVGLTHRNRGQLFCADVSSGEIDWSGPPRAGDNASLIAAGDVVLACLATGELQVLRPQADRLDGHATYKLSDTAIWAHPAISDGRLLVKDFEQLTCWQLK